MVKKRAEQEGGLQRNFQLQTTITQLQLVWNECLLRDTIWLVAVGPLTRILESSPDLLRSSRTRQLTWKCVVPLIAVLVNAKC